MKLNLGMKSIATLAPLALLLSSVGCKTPAAGAARTVDAGSKWEVAVTTSLSQLTVAPGASVTAPEGRSLTMTVDGVETPIQPGDYKGSIVLTPTQNIGIHYTKMDANKTYEYRTAIYVDNGAYVPEKSVSASVVGGVVTNTSAENIKISSVGELFNGIMVNGNSTYKIENPTISLTGNGRNDFAGLGAAIRTAGSSKVTIDNASIRNTGAVRTAIWVGEDSVATINNADIETNSGTLPKDYGWSWIKGGAASSDVMMEVPWMLGIRGNNRSTLVADNGTAYYNNSHIRAQAWGAMSTDAVSNESKLYLTKCRVETVESGYGAYTVGNTLVYSSGTTFDVADYGLIMAGGSGVFTDGSVVNSRRNGIMAHGGASGTLTIDKGSVFNTAKAVIQLKSSTPNILIDNATLNSKNGIILEMMPNDDPDMAMMAAIMAKHAHGAGAHAAMAPQPSGKYNTTNGTSDEFTTLKDATLKGDFVNTATASSGMNIVFKNASVTGAITTATAVHAVGPKGEKLVMQDAPDLYNLIGEQTETYAPTNDAHGAAASLDEHSTWIVDKTCYLTSLTVAPGAKISAPQGSKLTMTVNGVAKPIGVGAYKGKIVLKVAQGV